MPITSKIDQDFIEDSNKKSAITFSFTNGAWEQLKDLKNFFEQEDELEVIKLGISVLQKLKEEKEEKHNK